MSTVNIQVALLLARELLEACMFITSYFGAVNKSAHLTPAQKKDYYNFLSGGLIIAVVCGGIVSTIIGFVLAKAASAVETVAFAVELGEGLSKLIAAWFVTGMVFKIPIWFDISNYKNVEKSKKFASADKMGSKWEFCSMLFWNTFREFTEAGVITSTIVVLSPTGTSTLGASVALGLGLSVIIGIIFYFGAKYLSVRGFGIAGTCLAGLLSVGLISGAVHSLAESYADAKNLDYFTEVVYAVNNEDLGSVLAAFEFCGLSDYHTQLSFSVWILAMALVPYSVYRHHYLGKPTFMATIKNAICKGKKKKHHDDSEIEGDNRVGANVAVDVAEPQVDADGNVVNPLAGVYGPVSDEVAKQTGSGKKNAAQPKIVVVDVAVPKSTFNPGEEGNVNVKLKLVFPEGKSGPPVNVIRSKSPAQQQQSHPEDSSNRDLSDLQNKKFDVDTTNPLLAVSYDTSRAPTREVRVPVKSVRHAPVQLHEEGIEMRAPDRPHSVIRSLAIMAQTTSGRTESAGEADTVALRPVSLSEDGVDVSYQVADRPKSTIRNLGGIGGHGGKSEGGDLREEGVEIRSIDRPRSMARTLGLIGETKPKEGDVHGVKSEGGDLKEEGVEIRSIDRPKSMARSLGLIGETKTKEGEGQV